MITLKRTNDRKTANLANAAGNQSAIKNAFSLPAGVEFSCPGATAYCEKICYAGKLEKLYPSFRTLVLHNFEALKSASVDDMVSMLSAVVDDFRADCVRAEKRGKVAPLKFRIHADGDFFSDDYTSAWASVIRNNADVQFWAYTRVESSAVALHSAALPNLGLYFSGDPDNIKTALRMRALGIAIAFVAPTFKESREAIKGARCPEQNNKDFGLINEKGGACVRCGLCVEARGNVLFSASGK